MARALQALVVESAARTPAGHWWRGYGDCAERLTHPQSGVLVGQKKAIAIAVRNVSGRRRWSKLGEWLSAAPSASRLNGMAS